MQAVVTYCQEDLYTITKRIAFENGAEWADEHPKNPWISVKDRLPEAFEEVIAFAANGHIENSYWDGNYFTGDFYDTTVTHWMPIPELKEGGEL